MEEKLHSLCLRKRACQQVKPSWLCSGNCSLPQVACWLIWQGHRLPTLIQYYPSSRPPWTWQKEVSKVKPSYYMPHCPGPTTSSSNCPLTATKQGPCQRMLKGHWHWHHLHLWVSSKREWCMTTSVLYLDLIVVNPLTVKNGEKCVSQRTVMPLFATRS